jgi:hypothetical protein
LGDVTPKSIGVEFMWAFQTEINGTMSQRKNKPLDFVVFLFVLLVNHLNHLSFGMPKFMNWKNGRPLGFISTLVGRE